MDDDVLAFAAALLFGPVGLIALGVFLSWRRKCLHEFLRVSFGLWT